MTLRILRIHLSGDRLSLMVSMYQIPFTIIGVSNQGPLCIQKSQTSQIPGYWISSDTFDMPKRSS